MDFLKQFNITESFIDEMYNIYPEPVLNNFELNQQNVIRILTYFQEKKVDDLEWIILENIDLFIKPSDKVIALFEQHPDYIEKIIDKTIDLNNLF